MIKALAVTLFSTLLLSGCATESGEDPNNGIADGNANGNANLKAFAEGAWLLEDLAGTGFVDMTRVTLAFDGKGGFSGSGGCNRFSGSYSFTAEGVSFGPIAGTKRACPEAIMDQENRYFAALGSTTRAHMDGPWLMLMPEGSGPGLKFTALDDANSE